MQSRNSDKNRAAIVSFLEADACSTVLDARKSTGWIIEGKNTGSGRPVVCHAARQKGGAMAYVSSLREDNQKKQEKGKDGDQAKDKEKEKEKEREIAALKEKLAAKRSTRAKLAVDETSKERKLIDQVLVSVPNVQRSHALYLLNEFDNHVELTIDFLFRSNGFPLQNGGLGTFLTTTNFSRVGSIGRT